MFDQRLVWDADIESDERVKVVRPSGTWGRGGPISVERRDDGTGSGVPGSLWTDGSCGTVPARPRQETRGEDRAWSGGCDPDRSGRGARRGLGCSWSFIPATR